MTATRAEVIEAFRRQAAFCRDLHQAVLTAAIIDAARAEIVAGGPLADYVENFGEDPWKEALALRVAGALHYLVITDHAPTLAPYYSDGPRVPEQVKLQPIISALAASEETIFRHFISKPPQTNEIKRAAALLPGFSMIAQQTGLPMDLYELGASGGLLLAFDQYHIDYGLVSWGSGNVVLKSSWRGEPPDFSAPIKVGQRYGCDRAPVDLSDLDQLNMMHSYIWPEQKARHRLFDAAVEKRLAAGIVVDKSDALEWAAKKLRTLTPGRANVFFHSAFEMYLDTDRRRDLDDMFETAGAAATKETPLAKLGFEPVEVGESLRFEVSVQTWPGDGAKTIAAAHAHGEWVEPLAI